MALYHKWDVKNGFAYSSVPNRHGCTVKVCLLSSIDVKTYLLQFFSLISDGLVGVNRVELKTLQPI